MSLAHAEQGLWMGDIPSLALIFGWYQAGQGEGGMKMQENHAQWKE